MMYGEPGMVEDDDCNHEDVHVGSTHVWVTPTMFVSVGQTF